MSADHDAFKGYGGPVGSPESGLRSTHPDYPERTDTGLLFMGYWRSMDRRRKRDPDLYPLDLVDPTWDLTIRSRVVEHLRAGSVWHTWVGSSTCRFCGKRPNGNTCLTDGVFVWPEGLAHTVECHGVRLPELFVAHVLGSENL